MQKKFWRHWHDGHDQRRDLPVNRTLTGINILVTRPAHQAANLVDKIRSSGGNPIPFPVLEIRDVEDVAPLLELIDHLDDFDLAIFISPNAVDRAMSLIIKHRTLPQAMKIAVVGQGSARELKKFGVGEVIAPTTRFDSEALLGMAELQQIEGRRVVIFRGDRGRELLGDTLTERGASVTYAECYIRTRPDTDTTSLLESWSKNALHAVIITSSEGLRNLFEMVGESGQSWLKKTPLFVSHERISKTAHEMGFEDVISTDSGDEGLIKGLLDYFGPRVRDGVYSQETT